MRFLIALPIFMCGVFAVTALSADDTPALLELIQADETSDVDRANAWKLINLRDQ